MPKYRLTKPHFIGTTYHEAGAVIDHEGKPSRHMVPLTEKVAPIAQRPVTGPTPDSMTLQDAGGNEAA